MANDSWTTLNAGSGGDSMDESALTYGGAPTTRKRARVVIGDDATAAGLAVVQNVLPRLTNYALTVRIVDRAETGTNSSVGGTTSGSTTILAANAAGRIGASVFNDQGTSNTATLYLSLGATCTTSNFTVEVPPNGYYEVPGKYSGIITGVWSAGTGNARVTELT